MYLGRYQHHLEEKGRLSIPKKFRAKLDKGAILSQGLDGCLFLYPKVAWDELIEKLNQMPLTRADSRNFLRSLSYGAVEVDIDSLGRILLPDYLRDFAGIKADCVIAGAVDRIEIWDATNFEKFNTKISDQPKDFV